MPSRYSLTKTCPGCKFTLTESRLVYGDFDGWDDSDRVLDPRACPVCVRTEELTKKLAYQTARADANWKALCECLGEEE